MKKTGILSALVLGVVFSCNVTFAQDQIAELIVESLTTNMRPGVSVDLKGDYAILGGPGEIGAQWQVPGEAYIFWRDGTNWVPQARIGASDGAGRDRFGSVVAIWDPFAVVLASETGKVYVFHRDATNWNQTQIITPTGGCSAVDINDERMAIGAPNANGGATQSGAVYIYDLVPVSTTWVQSARAVADPPKHTGHMGTSVSIEGSNLLVGAWCTYLDGQRPGAAYLFEETGGVWTQRYVFSITNTFIPFIDYFGRDVALRGDQALIGGSSVSTDGRGFLYRRSGNNWIETAQLDDPIHTSFGNHVALGADWMAGMSIGAPSSAIMLYKNGASGVRRQIRYTAVRSASGYWGYHGDMAIDGQELIVGRYDTRSYTNHGALIYTVNPDNRQYRVDGTNSFIHSGMNEDGSGAVAIGTEYAAMAVLPSWETSGVVAIYFPSGQCWAVDTALMKRDLTDGRKYMGFGTALDMDGTTLAIGCPNAGSGSLDRVFAYWRNTNGWNEQAEFTLLTNLGFGTAVAIAGDFLAIGVPGANEPTFDEGAILMQERTGTNWAFHSKLTQTGAQFGDQFGTTVDMTTNYLISGAAWADTLEGRAWIFENNGGTWAQAQVLSPDDLIISDEFGADVAISETYAAVGAPGNTNGAVYLFHRTNSTWTQIAKLEAADWRDGDDYGAAVALNDHYLLVGASEHSVLYNQGPGRAYLYELDGTNVEPVINVWPGDPCFEYEYGRGVALSDTYGMVGVGTDAEGYVLYLPLIQQPMISSMSMAGNALALLFTDLAAGMLYNIQRTGALTSNWSTVDSFTPTTSSTNWSQARPGFTPVFYRLQSP